MLLLLAMTALAPADRATVVDGHVLRWADDRSEVALFGVNYYPRSRSTTPCWASSAWIAGR
ncbi:MAG: hypothetical protein M5U09_19085 [Gammaproteobacteria bacterium]|nr:hypothetical protein [Gammaproteobacteria bacterium]